MPARHFFPEVQRELRRIASLAMSHERADHTLQPTALVHEAWLRLRTQRNLGGMTRQAFLAAAAATMRRILVDHARGRRRDKRGGGWARVSLDEVDLGADRIDLVELDDAVEALARLSPRQARVVELRFFGGLTMTEIASLLSVSRETVHQDWCFARAWLAERLAADGPAPEADREC